MTQSTVISLNEVKQHLRLPPCVGDEDGYLTGLILTAQERAESILWRALPQRSCDCYLPRWPEGRSIRLPLPPLQSVELVEYTGETGAMQDFTAFYVDKIGEPGRIVLRDGASWPRLGGDMANPVHIRFTAGYDAERVPAAIKSALLLIIGDLYENRGEMSSSGGDGRAIMNLLMPFRVFKECDAVLES